MEHVPHGRGRELGIGAITEILLLREHGLQFVGPLPGALRNLTAYQASPTQASPSAAVQALLRQLGSAEAKATDSAAGIARTRQRADALAPQGRPVVALPSAPFLQPFEPCLPIKTTRAAACRRCTSPR